MSLSPQDSLLITLKTFTPFVNVQLLQPGPGGQPQPVAGAENTPIVAVCKRLDQLDKQYGIHTITYIIGMLHKLAFQQKHSIAVGASDLLGGTPNGNLQDIADLVETTSQPI
jgi:hypothetical protein